MGLTKLVGYKYFLRCLMVINKAKGCAMRSGYYPGLATICRKDGDSLTSWRVNFQADWKFGPEGASLMRLIKPLCLDGM
jgi:hypothetical protein